jgi:hypothetical protein
MVEDDGKAENFMTAFREQLSTIDDVVQVILNSHLQVEADLDDVLAAIFYHPERLEEARLTFMQKVHIARAFTWNMDERSDWSLMTTLNALRNEAVHRRKGQKGTKKVGELRRILLEGSTEKFRNKVRSASPKDVIVYAAAMAGGFLVVLEEHMKQMRKVLEEAAAEAGR